MKLLLVVLAVVLLLPGCDDPESPTIVPPPPPDYLPLTVPEAVLNNLELAYNHRNSPRVEALLDDSFTFYPSTGDVINGLPPQWDRGVEVAVTSNLFNKTQVGDLDLVKSIEMDVQFEHGLQWDPIAEGDETRYTTTVFYFFQITVQQEPQDITYYPDSNSRARFTVRNAGTEDAPEWQLVEWRDLGSSSQLRAASAAFSAEEATWGAVKARYNQP